MNTKRHGFAMVLWALVMVLFMGFLMILLIDMGRAYIVRTQLRAIADAAGLAAFNAYQKDNCAFCNTNCQNISNPDDKAQCSRIEAAMQAATNVATNNHLLDFNTATVKLKENQEVLFGSYDGNAFSTISNPRSASQYPYLNAVKVVPQLGVANNAGMQFKYLFSKMTLSNRPAQTINIGAESIISGALNDKILLVDLILDSSFSMAYSKYCQGGSLTPPAGQTSGYSCDSSNGGACKGVRVKSNTPWVAQDGSQGGTWITCPPKWSHGDPTWINSDPNYLTKYFTAKGYFNNDCGRTPIDVMPVWSNARLLGGATGCIPQTYAMDQLPTAHQKAYPNLEWAPQPMYQILQSANRFVDNIAALNPPNANSLELHQVGAYTFSSPNEPWSFYVYPSKTSTQGLTTNYTNLKQQLIIQKIFPKGQTAMCSGMIQGFSTLERAWNYTVQTGINPSRLVPVLIILSDLNKDEPNYDCNGASSNGSTGRASTLAQASTMDDDFYNRVTGQKTRVTIFTVSVLDQPSAGTIQPFMESLARNGGSYIFAKDVEDIDGAFDKIIIGLKRNLRLVK